MIIRDLIHLLTKIFPPSYGVSLYVKFIYNSFSVSTTDNGYANRDLGVDSPGDMKDLTYYLDDVVVPGTGNKPGNGMILPGATTTEMSGIITKG